VQESSDLADVHFVRQGDPKGLGHAVLRARKHVGDESFAVLLGDDLIDARDPLLTRMLDEHDKRGATVVALLEVDPASIHLYGAPPSRPPTTPTSCASPTSSRSRPPTWPPSNFAVIGRYVLKPEVFDILEHTKPGKGGEIQLTDALMEMAGDVEGTGGVYGVIFRGRRYDTGDKLDYIKAVVQLAADRDDLGPELRPWLVEYVAGFDRT
jgi:UTP--glucose-1-phosphate uridylyltransferase